MRIGICNGNGGGLGNRAMAMAVVLVVVVEVVVLVVPHTMRVVGNKLRGRNNGGFSHKPFLLRFFKKTNREQDRP